MKIFTSSLLLATMMTGIVNAQENTNLNKFRQMKQEFATPNVYHTASGAPGPQYWQQRADYKMNIRLDDDHQRIYGTEVITYHNQSPDVLTYLWLQLDQNIRAKDSDTPKIQTSRLDRGISMYQLQRENNDFDGGFKIDYVNDSKGSPLPYTINKTMMRIDLPEPLKAGTSYSFSVKWWYNINNMRTVGGRSGYEFFEKDSNYVYTIAQFYPRMAVYNDVEGWQNKQFLGNGEFTLTFGNFDVNITVPADHILCATGELQNKNQVLTSAQLDSLKKAENSSKPVLIVTQEEAEKAEQNRTEKEKTWIYKARNVRDFAFASSRRFIWDAMGVKFGSRTVMAMSLYPGEGNPLWGQFATRAVAHTLRSYSRRTFDYPYPEAIAVHTQYLGGMEYPMICFCSGRPQPDGTYSEGAKYNMISTIIHEVGHNYFPMIVNSDERQWTWMDEGINSFLEFLAEQEWEYGFPTRAGQPYKIVRYMSGDKKNMSPIMTNSELIQDLSDNAYNKTTTALNILRETVMGRKLFDYAFKVYANRWKFKQPMPEDFFRTMEDASAVDLDWFWRGWFYTTDDVDISLENVHWYQPDTENPDVDKPLQKKEDEERMSITDIRNKADIKNTVTERDPATHDFYSNFDKYKVTASEREMYANLLAGLSDQEKAYLNGNYNFYQIDFRNKGGLVMPIILKFTFTDKSDSIVRIPAEIWEKDNDEVSKVFIFQKEVSNIVLDPFLETADVDTSNNYWPPKIEPTRIDILQQGMYRRGRNPGFSNPMRQNRNQQNNN